MTKTLLSLFDYSGQWSAPFADAGWMVVQVDISGKSEKTKMLRSLTPEGFSLAFCAANAGGQLGQKIRAIDAAADEIVKAPPSGISAPYIGGFLQRRLPDIRLQAWERTAWL